MKQQRLSVVYLGMGVMFALVVSMLLSSVISTYASNYSDSPVASYGMILPSSFPVQLPMKGDVSLRTSSDNHRCYQLGQNQGQAQDCYAMDFSATNTGIYPVADGIVRLVVSDFETQTTSFVCYGNMVIIEHPKKSNDQITFYSLYAHLKSVTDLKENMAVSRDQRIGEMGDTGQKKSWSEGNPVKTGNCGEWPPHLHFALYQGLNIQTISGNKGPHGGKSVAIGYSTGDATFSGCAINKTERCDRLYRYRQTAGLALSLSTSNNAPPQLQSPASGTSTTNGIWPTLQWSTGSAPYGYRIQVSKNDAFSSTEVDQCSTNTNYLPTGTGAESFMRDRRGTLNWRVAYVKSAWNNNQTTCKSVGINGDWSQTWSFNNQIIITPILTSPTNGYQTNNGLWPTLVWTSNSQGPFEIRVSRNPDFSDCVVCESTSGYRYYPSGSGAEQWMREQIDTFYWRVRVVGGSWSDTRTFRNIPLAYSNNFSSHSNGWNIVRGNWGVDYQNGLVKGYGSINEFTSIKFTTAKFSDVDYAVTVYRTGTSGYNSPNVIYVRGDPEPDTSRNYIWRNAVYLSISQSGGVSYGENVQNTSGWHSGWFTSGSVRTNNWNVLRIRANGNNYKFYVNDIKVGEFSSNNHKRGFVGAAMYASTSTSAAGIMHIDSFSVSPN
jgi:murein DD-endopeptidase MepM/ murein hydrolase activator NlpD